MNNNKTIFDATVIGAGIGGLVCGCYLAKAGLKVLIVEQHNKPGGYCTSFKRKGFTFDAAAHSLGGYKYGNLGKIFKDLEIDNKLKINKIDPSDSIITPDYKISFWEDLDKTISDFQAAFPDESANIKDFFYFLTNPESKFFLSNRGKSFKDLLDQYFINDKLKSILSFPLFGTSGLPHYKMSAFMGTKIFKEFLIDGGYYPEDGIQSLPNALVEKFKEFGGELRLSCLVKKIKVENRNVVGIKLEKGEMIPSKYVISNCDTRQTFLKLLDKNDISYDYLNKINNMIPSLSGFILYLIVDKNFRKLTNSVGNLWYLCHYNINKAYTSAKKGDLTSSGGFVLHIYPDNQRIFAFMNAPFKNRKFWIVNKKKLIDFFIHMIENKAIPTLSKNIIHKEAATPHTLNKYTLNYKGAAFGWAATPEQLAVPGFKKPSFLKNLYLTGHWTTHGLGIPGVAYTGFDVATSILRRTRETILTH